MTIIPSIKSHNGFSLLEVLVAFAIAAVSLGVIFQIYAKGTRAALLGEEYAQAVAIAESRLAAAGVPENLTRTAENGRANNKYDWQLLIADYVSDEPTGVTPALLLKKVDVSVRWMSGGKSRSIQLQSLKPMPAT